MPPHLVDYTRFRCDELRMQLRERRLPVTGIKAHLIMMLQEDDASRMAAINPIVIDDSDDENTNDASGIQYAHDIEDVDHDMDFEYATDEDSDAAEFDGIEQYFEDVDDMDDENVVVLVHDIELEDADDEGFDDENNEEDDFVSHDDLPAIPAPGRYPGFPATVQLYEITPADISDKVCPICLEDFGSGVNDCKDPAEGLDCWSKVFEQGSIGSTAVRLGDLPAMKEEKGSANSTEPTPTGWTYVMSPSRHHQVNRRGERVDSSDPDNKDAVATEDANDFPALQEVRSDDELLPEEDGGSRTHRSWGTRRNRSVENHNPPREEPQLGRLDQGGSHVVYKVYKRRWFGMVQLALLNIIVSWDWLSFSPVSTTALEYYGVSNTAINWLSTSYLFSFVVISPVTIWLLNRGGPRAGILCASVLLLTGNWIRYGGTVSKNFGVVCFGQILTGLAQPFVLSAPTGYSELWFTGNGRVAATAVMSLANPFGGALGQLIDPFLATKPSEIPSMVLIIAIIATIASIPSFFIPAKPPTPPSHSAAIPKQPILPSLKYLLKLPEFYMIFLPFAIYVGLFNSISSLLNQILEPFGFSETAAGIAGAILIVVGLLTAAVTSPLVDRYKFFLPGLKLFVPIVGIAYLAFVWAPPTRSFAAVYVILGILGAASFSLVPLVLEYLCDVTYPVSPEVTSSICWSAGQLLGGIFIVVSDKLTDGPNGGLGGKTPHNMQRALWLQAVLALAVVPVPLALGCCGRRVRNRRTEADRDTDNVVVVSGNREEGAERNVV